MIDILIPSVTLAGEQASQNAIPGGGLVSLLPMVAIFVVFYFLLIRPQIKKQKEQSSMINSLKKGDKVVAAGGIIGVISKIDDNVVSLDIGSDTKIQIVRSTITDNLTKTSETKKGKLENSEKSK